MGGPRSPSGFRPVLWLFLLLLLPSAAAVAQEGSLLWAVSLQGYSSSSPALSRDGRTVYVGVETRSAGRIVAINSDGSVKWAVVKPDWISCSPAVGPDGTVYVGCYDGRLYALDPSTGSSRWEFDTRTFVFSSPAITADGLVVFGAGDSRLHAVNSSGREVWSFQAGDWIDSSPSVAADGTIYFGSRDRALYALNPDGSERWRFLTEGSVYSSPAIGSDGTIYFGSADRRIYAVSPAGRKLWEHETGGEVLGSVALGADGVVYVASLDGRIHALEKEDGFPRWSVSLGRPSIATPAVRGDGAVIIGGDDGVLRALAPRDGAVLWRFDTRAATGDGIESSALVAGDGSIYFASLDGRLYKLRGNGSPLSRLSNWPAFRRDEVRTGRSVHASSGGRLLNLSSRGELPAGSALIAGFVLEGSGSKPLLLRGVGPGLSGFGVPGVLENPVISLFAGTVRMAGVDDWDQDGSGPAVSAAAASAGAFPLEQGSADAALLSVLGTGIYSVHLSDAGAGGGAALVEVYDTRSAERSPRLSNLSLRAPTGPGEKVLITGVVVGPGEPARVLVRAIGPGLAQFGVEGAVQFPLISVFQGQRLIATGGAWTEAGLAHDISVASAGSGAFPLSVQNADAALTVTLDPGPYTIQVADRGGGSGEVLAELYILR